MVNLIRNELTKIIHKKSIYIVLIIAIGVMILTSILSTIFSNYNINIFDETEYIKAQLSELNKNDPIQREVYIGLQAELETIQLTEKYGRDSWQSYVISKYAQSIVENKIRTEGTDLYNESKDKYDKFIQKLDNNEWSNFVKDEIQEINISIEEVKNPNQIPEQDEAQKRVQELSNRLMLEELNDKKQVLEWRLEKDIPYGNSNLNNMLEKWSQSREQLRQYNEQEKQKPLTYSEKYDKQNQTTIKELSEYAIRNRLENIQLGEFNENDVLATKTNSQFLDVFSDYGIFITIAIVIIAGTIVSEEFNKGTIKLLLVRPYRRIKILMAKFITCLIVLALVYIIIAIARFVVLGVTNGFQDYDSKVAIYSFRTNSVESISTFNLLVLKGLAILPEYVLIMTLAFSISTIIVNSPVAVALPLMGTMGAEIINGIAYNFKQAEFLKFFVTPNWDLSIYLFGKIPEFEPISLPFSIIICLVYFAVMLVVSSIIFKKKDIKNI